MAKTRITRTYGPIHFEDLDPHRFEDLIRELIYDYKDWQTIEAVGRGGADDGFDIRAFEKASRDSSSENGEDEDETTVPMSGNLWMVQCKREKTINPERIRSIISDAVKASDPPYGYILATSANVSKKSYDVFHEELGKRGVMEFYLWSKAELEDMLHMPKNDRILFTFFGISLVSRKKSRSTEIRSVVNIKNKLYRTLGDGHEFYRSVLVRDLKDVNYPYKKEYKDFDKKPRWKEYIAYGYHPLGLWLHSHKYFAYIDTSKKEWDFTSQSELIHRQSDNHHKEQESFELEKRVRDFWECLPKSNQGYFVIDGIIKYDKITVIDDKGDVLYNFPHLFVDFVGDSGPFDGFINILDINNTQIDLSKDYKRIRVFPDTFPECKIGKVHTNKSVDLDSKTLISFTNGYGKVEALYDTDGKYNFLNQRDIIPVAGANKGNEQVFIKITQKFKTKIKDYLEKRTDNFRLRISIEQQLGRQPNEDEDINVYEFKEVYKWEFEKS